MKKFAIGLVVLILAGAAALWLMLSTMSKIETVSGMLIQTEPGKCGFIGPGGHFTTRFDSEFCDKTSSLQGSEISVTGTRLSCKAVTGEDLENTSCFKSSN